MSTTLQVPIKRLFEDAKIPVYSRSGDACLDLFLHSTQELDEYLTETNQADKINFLTMYQVRLGSGIALAIPEGHVGLLFMRSGTYNKTEEFTNAVGVIDENYRGEISAICNPANIIVAGMVTPAVLADLVENLMKTQPAIAKQLSKLIDGYGEVAESQGEENAYKVGDRFAQLLIIPKPTVELIPTDGLPPSNRGTQGHGSSGN